MFLAACPEPASTPAAPVSAVPLYSPDGFTPMPEPRDGEWLDRFEEPGQTVEQYRASDPVRATESRAVLAFLPTGPFTGPERELALAAVEFAGIWFQLPTRILPDQGLPRERWQRKAAARLDGREITQYRTDWFLERLLPEQRPEDAVCLTSVTMGDLYPSSDWNYVFGQAKFRERVAVYSLARLHDSFHGGADTKESLVRTLRRAAALVTHELGHCFGLYHCIYYRCNMNGSNSLRESDSQPLRLCPVCLEKLHWNRGFDAIGRYRDLLDFYERHGLAEEASWIRNRLIRLGEPE